MSSSALPHPHHKPNITETELMLNGYGLTLARIYYRMPDYRNVLNEFIWQEYDLYPDYPRLFGFIEFWQREIEGPLHSVEFTHRRLISRHSGGTASMKSPGTEESGRKILNFLSPSNTLPQLGIFYKYYTLQLFLPLFTPTQRDNLLIHKALLQTPLY